MTQNKDGGECKMRALLEKMTYNEKIALLRLLETLETDPQKARTSHFIVFGSKQ